jgi:A/G-specific adenine glycosylase
VAKLWDQFVKRYPDAQTLSKANRDELRALISVLGFGRMRSDVLILAAKWLMAKCDAEVPCDVGTLLKIPHVGTYTAHAILCFAFGEKKEIVDANVLRFFSRYYGNWVC